MPFTCASPLRSVWIGAGVGGKVSHLSAASAGRTARTRVGASRNGRMSFSLWASKYLLAFRLQTSLASRCLQTPFPSLALSRHYFFAKVRFAPTDYRAKRRERRKIMTLTVDEFIRRFLNCGLFAKGSCADNIISARELLAAAEPEGHPTATTVNPSKSFVGPDLFVKDKCRAFWLSSRLVHKSTCWSRFH